MKRFVMGCMAALMMLAATTAFAGPVGTVFTYQGKLTDNGAPANGSFDLKASVYDAKNLGNLIAGPIPVNGVSVTDGLLNAEIDFGNVFTGTALFLEIQVSPAGQNTFVTLTPRQPLNTTPFAAYALNGNWTASGSAIKNANTGFVGINRTDKVSGSEYFGIQAAASGTNYGGMYIRTDSTTAKPFYGYSTGSGGKVAWSYLDGSDGTLNFYNGGVRMTIEETGDVGIGTSNPGAKLHVDNGSDTGNAIYATESGASGQVAQFYVPSGGGAYGLYAVTYGSNRAALFESHTSNTTATVHVYKNGGPALQVTGAVGAGTHDSTSAMSIIGGTDSEPGSGGFLVLGSVASANISIDNNEIMARSNGATSTLYLNNDGGNVVISPTGHTIVSVLEITGGSDLSEGFEVNADKIEPGMVVVIDESNPGELKLATSAYDHKVAGIISGAGGVKTGLVMGQNGSLADGKHPVALSGRVYCWCDASNGAIEAGDLLTTSATPGHAMKVADHAAAQGAIIGKAMTSLKQGEKGLVLVLVSLQ